MGEARRIVAKMKRAARIREVWASNVEQEIETISRLIGVYNHVAMDTEFPGVVVRLVANQAADANYQTLRHNVDLLKIIQLGLTISDADGQSPPEGTTWQFNFAFSLSSDIYAQESIDLLTSCGLDFGAHERDGIDVLQFGDLLTTSGLLCNEAIRWVSFHGSYDFAYFTKVLVSHALPESEEEFFKMLRVFFPQRYDLKCLVRKADHLFGGLNKIAEQLGCERFGTMHQAGSDSLLTLDVFMRVRDDMFHGVIDDAHVGVLFGLGSSAASSSSKAPLTAAVPARAYSPGKLLPRGGDASGNGAADAPPQATPAPS